MMDKLKKGLIGSILISVILAVTLGYVWATTPTTTFYISTGVYPGAPSYTVWTEGSGITQTYYAKRYDGYFPTFSGSTNASYIFDSVFDLVDGNVLVQKGTYNITTRITIHNDTTVYGFGKDTLFAHAPATLDYFIYIGNNSDNVVLRDFAVDVNNASGQGTGIYGLNNDNVLIENLYVTDADGHALFLDGTASGMATNIRIINNHVFHTHRYPIQIRNVFHASIANNNLDNNQTGIIGHYGSICVWTGCQDITVLGNTLTGGELGINSNGRYVTITANTVSKSYYGMWIEGNFTTISSNTIKNVTIGMYVNGYNTPNGFQTDILGNMITDVGEEGIQVVGNTGYNVTGIAISGNDVTDVSKLAGTHASIGLANIFYDVVTSNYCQNPDYYGVYDSGGGHHIVVGNDYHNTSGGSQVDGAGNEVAHNIGP